MRQARGIFAIDKGMEKVIIFTLYRQNRSDFCVGDKVLFGIVQRDIILGDSHFFSIEKRYALFGI